MMKISLPLLVLCSSLSYSQVGINNTDPKATLDITARTTDASKPEGLIAPRLTGDQIRGKNTQYDIPQTGTIIYATAADSSPAGKTANITAPGYYYFDGIAWQKISGGGTSAGDATNDAWINDATNTIVKLGTQADGSTARVAGTEFVAKDNGAIGIGTVSPDASAQLDVTSSNKGFLPPRVALTAINDKSPLPASTPTAGILVYNTATTSNTPYDVSPGYYYWDGSKWASITASTTNQAIMTLTDCSSMKVTGASLVKGKPAAGQITLSVNVTKAGKWNLMTNSVNGVYFAGGGEFYYTGTQTITLYAQGTATATASPATFTVTVGSTSCSVNINIFDISSYTMKVLSLTPDTWGTNIASGSSNTNLKSKLNNTSNFGPSGVVTVGGFSFSDYNVQSGNAIELAAQLENTNILWIGWPDNSYFNAAELSAIKNWLDAKKGVAIFHADDPSHNAWVANLGYSSTNYGSATGFQGSGSISPLVGSFGNLNGAGFTISTGANRGAINGLGTVLMIDTDESVYTPRMILNGNYVIIADVDLSYNGVITSGVTISSNNDKLYGNVFEWAVKNAPLK
ncbi:hypothetical protein [Chryseobacterium ginsengisoli]